MQNSSDEIAISHENVNELLKWIISLSIQGHLWQIQTVLREQFFRKHSDGKTMIFIAEKLNFFNCWLNCLTCAHWTLNWTNFEALNSESVNFRNFVKRKNSSANEFLWCKINFGKSPSSNFHYLLSVSLQKI